MRKFLWLPVAAATLAAGSYPASAKNPSLAEQRDAIQAVNQLADCYVTTEQKKIEAVLSADPKSAAFERWEDGHNADCYMKTWVSVGGHVNTEGEALRYALAEALFRKEFRQTHLSDLAQLPPLAQGSANYKWRYENPMSKAELEQEASDQRAGLYLSALGECVVRANPEGSRQLLLSDALTSEEDAAFATLNPSLGGCIDKAQQVHIDRQSLRGAIALEYVRLALAPRLPVLQAGAQK